MNKYSFTQYLDKDKKCFDKINELSMQFNEAKNKDTSNLSNILYMIRVHHGKLLHKSFRFKKYYKTTKNKSTHQLFLYNISIYESMIHIVQKNIQEFEEYVKKNILRDNNKTVLFKPIDEHNKNNDIDTEDIFSDSVKSSAGNEDTAKIDELLTELDSDDESVLDELNIGSTTKEIVPDNAISAISQEEIIKNLTSLSASFTEVSIKNEQNLDDGKHDVIFIYSRKCHHCKKFYDDWNKLFKKFTDIFNLSAVDSELSKNKKLVEHKSLNLKGVPALYIFKNNVVYDYYVECPGKKLNYNNAKVFINNILK